MSVLAADSDPDVERPGRSKLTSRSLVVAAGTLVSRVTGVGRVVVVAAVLGPTYFGNLFESANFLPNIIFVLLTGPYLVAFVVPHLVRGIGDGGRREAADLTRNLVGFVLVVFGALAALVALLAPTIIGFVTIGVDDPDVAARQRELGALLLMLVAPQIVLYGLAGVATAAQHARRHFGLAASAPALENLGVVVTMLVFASMFGTGQALDEIGRSEILVLGLGSTASVALHCAAQLAGAARVGLPALPRFDFAHPAVVAVLRDARSVTPTAVMQGFRHLSLLVVSGTVPGGVIAFRMALNFYNLPLGLAAKPVAAAALPELSESSEGEDDAVFHDHVDRAFALALFLAVPAAAAYVVLASPLAATFAFGEMASDRGIELLTIAIVTLGPGIVGASVDAVATAVSYSRGDPVTPLRAMTVRTVTSAIGLLVGVWWFSGTALLIVLGLSFSVGDTVGAVVHRRALVARFGRAGPGLRRSVISTGLASIGLGTAAGAVVWSLTALESSRATSMATLLLAGGVGAVVYTFVQRQSSSDELFDLVPRLRPSTSTIPTQSRTVPAVTDRANTALLGVSVVTAVGASALSAVDVRGAVGLVGAVAIVLVVMARPWAAAAIYLGLTPLIAGLPRGGAIPLMRPAEALLALLIGAVLLERFRRLMLGEALALRWGPLHGPLLAMCVSSSVLPLMWMTARGEAIGADDLLFSVALWKFFALYVLVRSVVRTHQQVIRCVAIALVSHVLVGTVAILQAVGLFGVPGVLASLYADSARQHANNRGSSLLDSSHAVGDTMTICLALVIALIAVYGLRPLFLGLGGFFFLAALSSGQISTIGGLLVGIVVAGALTGQLAHVSRSAVFGITGGALLLQQTISRRLASVDETAGVPTSWLARWDNLTAYFLPELLEGANLLLGVRPAARVAAPELWRDWVWIDSGLVWLLWTGGLPLLFAFVWFITRGIRTTGRIARRGDGPVRVAAVGAAAGLSVVVALTVLDAHLTLRGTADLLFPLLALATASAVPRRSPRSSSTAAVPEVVA